MKKAGFHSLIPAVSCAGILALFAGLLPGCGQFGYGPLAKSIEKTIQTARAGNGPGTESGQVTGIDSPEFDMLLSSCVQEPITRPYGIALQARLSALLGETIPEASRREALAQAHRSALGRARWKVIECLRDSGQTGVLARFLRQWRDQFAAQEGDSTPERDLARALAAILTQEGTPRASAFLRIYYRRFVRAIDPLARLSDETLPGGALLLPHEGAFAGNGVSREGADVTIALRDLDAADAALSELERELSAEPRPERLRIDLRSSGGVSVPALERVHAALHAAAETLPATVTLDNGTRGTAELLAAALSPLESTTLVGEPTAGYALEPCESRVEPGLSLAHGCRELSSPVVPSGAGFPVVPDHAGPRSPETRDHLYDLMREGRVLPYRNAPEAWARVLHGNAQAPDSPTDQQ